MRIASMVLRLVVLGACFPAFLRSQVIDRANVEGPIAPMSMSADGNVVAFTTRAALLPEDQDNAFDNYIYDLAQRQIVLVRAEQTASGAEDPSFRLGFPVLSADGETVYFRSSFSDPFSAGTIGGVYAIRWRPPSRERLVNVCSDGTMSSLLTEPPIDIPGSGFAVGGNTVAFLTDCPELDADGKPIPNRRQYGVYANLGGNLVLLVPSSPRLFDGARPPLAVSGDGNRIFFRQDTPPQINGLYFYDIQSQSRVEVFSPGILEVISGLAADEDGTVIAFYGRFAQEAGGVFAHVVSSGVTTRLTPNLSSLLTRPVGLSANGAFVAFEFPGPLVPHDTNARSDVYLANRLSGETVLLSATPEGIVGNQASVGPVLSADGSLAAFRSAATNFLDGGSSSADIYFAAGGFLRVTVSGPAKVLVGQRGRYRATVTNFSPEVARDVVLRVERQAQALSIFSDPTSDCDAGSPDVLICQLGELDSRVTAIVEFSLLSLGVEIVPYHAAATGEIDGTEVSSNDVDFAVFFDRCFVELRESQPSASGTGVDLLFLYEGPGEGDVDFSFGVEPPAVITEEERVSEEFFSITLEPNRFGDVPVLVTASRGTCEAELLQVLTFLQYDRVPDRSADTPQELAAGDLDAAATAKARPCSVFLQNGENRIDRTDLVIPGRGDIHFEFTRRYRSQIRFGGPMGHNWDFNYNETLVEQPDGNVVRVNGKSHVDTWERNPDGTYASPRGFFSTLLKEADESFVLREPDGFKRLYDAQGRLRAHEDRNGNRMTFEYDIEGNLAFAVDPYGRVVEFVFEAGRLARIRDFIGREVVYSYDQNGDLVTVRTPVVAGTSPGNDFPEGRTERYAYSSGFADEDLNHNLLQIVAAEETASGGPPVMAWSYGNDPADPLTFDRVLTQTEGGTNDSGVAAGGSTNFAYEALNGEEPPGNLALPRLKVAVTDRKTNVIECYFNEGSQHILTRELTRGMRADEPEAYETRYEYDEDDQLVRKVQPAGNEIRYVYDRAGPRGAQRNAVEIRRVADPARGGGEDLVTTMTYEPLFNRLASVTDPRGNSASFDPPLGEASAERYTWRYFYDYQEGDQAIPEAEKFGFELASVSRGFGDLNGDGRTDQSAGNCVRASAPDVLVRTGAREAQRLGRQLQGITFETQWNERGQKLAEIDPEGNVVAYSYYGADDPDGDGTPVPAPVGTGATGYVRSVTVDARSSPRRLGDHPPAMLETVLGYDPVGNVTAMRNPRGVTTTIEVNQLNEPVEITRGAAIDDAEASGQLITGEEAFRYRIRFFYDHNGRLVKSETENRDSNTEGVGEFIQRGFTYDILDNLVEWTVEVDDETDLVWQRRYDANEQPSLLIEPEGNQHAIEYDERDLPFLMTRGLGSAEESTTRFDYDLNGNRERLVDAEDNDGDGLPEAWRVIYDGFDRVVELVDPLGNRTVEHYDPNSNLVRRQSFGHPPGGAPTAGTPSGPEALLAESFLHVDEIDRVYRIDEALFISTGYEAVRPITLEDENADGLVTTLREHDRSSRLTFVVEDDGEVSETVYDGADRPVERKDQAGNRVVVEYDQNSNPLRVSQFERATDGLVADEEYSSFYVYDQLDRLIRFSDNLGQTTRFAYDSRDELIASSDPEGPLGPDPLGEIPGPINGSGNTRSWFHDGLGRVIREVRDLRAGGQGGNPLDLSNSNNSDGQISLATLYDGNSRVVGVADDNGNRTSFGYDALNRQVLQRNADGEEFRYAYDRDNNVIGWTDPNGSTVTNVFDAINRLLERRVQRGPGVEGTTRETLGYDGLSRLAFRTDEDDTGAVHRIDRVYDSLSRLWEERQSVPSAAPPGQRFLRGDCNGDGSLAGVTDAVFLLGFNFLGSAPPPCRAACDSNGDDTTAGVTDAVYLLSFNFLGTPPPPPPFPGCGEASTSLACDSSPACSGSGEAQEAAGVGVMSAVWSGDDKRLSATYPGGRTIGHGFDAIDRIRTVRDGRGMIADCFWIGPDYRELLRRCGNGTSLSYLNDSGAQIVGYDGVRRPVKMRCFLPAGAGAFLDREHTYNRASMRTLTRRVDDSGVSDIFTYDSIYRLIKTELDRGGSAGAISRDTVAIDYLFDGAGNRRQVYLQRRDGTGLEQVYDVNEVNEYTAVVSTALAHDENGNLVDDGSRVFAYDFKNRLTSVHDTETGNPVARYTYHGDGRRARKVVFDPLDPEAPPIETVFYYDGWRVCEEQSAAGATEATFVWSPMYVDELVQIERGAAHPLGPAVLYAHQDVESDVVALTDASGRVVEKRYYDDYGNAVDEAKRLAASSAVGNPYGFKGRRLDPETGLYYFRRRYYDPRLGRFLQRDSLDDEVNVHNQYGFVGNSPASRNDPSGLLTWESTEFRWHHAIPVFGWGHYILSSTYLDPPPPPRDLDGDGKADRQAPAKGPQPKSPVPGKGGQSKHGFFAPYQLKSHEEARTACVMLAEVDLIMALQPLSGATQQTAKVIASVPRQVPFSPLGRQWLQNPSPWTARPGAPTFGASRRNVSRAATEDTAGQRTGPSPEEVQRTIERIRAVKATDAVAFEKFAARLRTMEWKPGQLPNATRDMGLAGEMQEVIQGIFQQMNRTNVPKVYELGEISGAKVYGSKSTNNGFVVIDHEVIAVQMTRGGSHHRYGSLGLAPPN